MAVAVTDFRTPGHIGKGVASLNRPRRFMARLLVLTSQIEAEFGIFYTRASLSEQAVNVHILALQCHGIGVLLIYIQTPDITEAYGPFSSGVLDRPNRHFRLGHCRVVGLDPHGTTMQPLLAAQT